MTIFRQIDADGGGSITMKEFQDWWMASVWRVSSPANEAEIGHFDRHACAAPSHIHCSLHASL